MQCLEVVEIKIIKKNIKTFEMRNLLLLAIAIVTHTYGSKI